MDHSNDFYLNFENDGGLQLKMNEHNLFSSFDSLLNSNNYFISEKNLNYIENKNESTKMLTKQKTERGKNRKYRKRENKSKE